MTVDYRLVDIFVRVWNRNHRSWFGGEGLVAENINWGWCYQFALVIHGVYGGELISSCGHAWVRIGEWDYDSEHLSGGDIYSYGRSVYDRDQFISYWNNGGGSGPVCETTIAETIQEFMKLKQNEAA